MARFILIIVVALLVSCTAVHEFNLKQDGTVYLNGEALTDEDLKNDFIFDEIILHVDYDVPYDKVKELMIKLKEGGVRKVGLITGENK